MTHPKIIDYQVVTVGSGGMFNAGKGGLPITKEVKKLIEEGWQPIGGIAVQGGLFYQALVKYE